MKRKNKKRWLAWRKYKRLKDLERLVESQADVMGAQRKQILSQHREVETLHRRLRRAATPVDGFIRLESKQFNTVMGYPFRIELRAMHEDSTNEIFGQIVRHAVKDVLEKGLYPCVEGTANALFAEILVEADPSNVFLSPGTIIQRWAEMVKRIKITERNFEGAL